jgi:NAD(P)-dependent dehydrogenase (short-subunit alcohol dehydrogenase family)
MDIQGENTMKNILVTGGNSGIGFALCSQLVDEGHRVFLGSRNKERGEAAVAKIAHSNCSLLVIDVASPQSVDAAAQRLRSELGDETLYAIVNNAGVGLMHADVTPLDVVDINLLGAKRVCEAFIPLLQKTGGRIANTSSGAASSYVAGAMMGKPMGIATAAQKKPLINPDVTWEQIQAVLKIEQDGGFTRDESRQSSAWCAYALSKAGLTAYAMLLARTYPDLVVSSCSPGFIKTKMTAGWDATLEPKDGTKSLKHCLFSELGGKGWYFGSDGLRSPLHVRRNPGEPAFNGAAAEPGEPAW